MTLDTGTEVAREKFHILPMPDVVITETETETERKRIRQNSNVIRRASKR